MFSFVSNIADGGLIYFFADFLERRFGRAPLFHRRMTVEYTGVVFLVWLYEYAIPGEHNPPRRFDAFELMTLADVLIHFICFITQG